MFSSNAGDACVRVRLLACVHDGGTEAGSKAKTAADGAGKDEDAEQREPKGLVRPDTAVSFELGGRLALCLCQA